MWNDFLILYCHKELHRRWSVGPRSACGLFFFLWEILPKRLKFNQIDIYIFKVKKKSTRTRWVICPKVFYEYLASLQENIHTKVPHGYSSVNMLHTCSRTPFLVKTSGELLLYIALNREIINVKFSLRRWKTWLSLDGEILVVSCW